MTYPLVTTGTTTYTVARNDILSYALRKLGVLEQGTTLAAGSAMEGDAATSLEMLCKTLVVTGSKLWTIQELVLPAIATQTTYNIGPTGSVTPLDLATDKPLYLMQAWLRNISYPKPIDIPLMILPQADYNTLGSKQASGTPNSVQLQVLRDYSVLKSYVTPDTYAAAQYVFRLLVKRTIQDVGIATNNLDFPQEWYLPLGWMLAAELVEDYEVPPQKAQRIYTMAEKFRTQVEDFDTEQASVFFTPTTRFTKG